MLTKNPTFHDWEIFFLQSHMLYKLRKQVTTNTLSKIRKEVVWEFIEEKGWTANVKENWQCADVE